MNSTTKTDILKYILNIEFQLQQLKDILQISSAPGVKSDLPISYSSSPLYDVFLDVDEIIKYYVDNIGYPIPGKKISLNNLKIKTVKFLEKYNCNKTVFFKIIDSIQFPKNISYDLFLKKIENVLIGLQSKSKKAPA